MKFSTTLMGAVRAVLWAVMALGVTFGVTQAKAQAQNIGAIQQIQSSGGGAPSGPAGGVLNGTYPNPGFAASPSFVGPTTVTQTALGTTTTAGLSLINSTAAALGAQQVSPCEVLQGNGWGTTGSASQTVAFCTDILPVQGTTPTGTWRLRQSINAAGYADAMTVTSAGLMTTPSGISASGLITTTNSIVIGTAQVYGFASSDTTLFRSAAGKVGVGLGSTAATGELDAGGVVVNNTVATTGVSALSCQDGAGQSSTACLQVKNVGGTTNFSVTGAGTIVAAGGISVSSVTSGGNILAGSTTLLGFNGRSLISAPSDGNLRLTNAAGTDFGLLQFGGTTSSFPAFKRSTTGILVRLADDSADAPLTSSDHTVTNQKATTGQRFACLDTNGKIVSSVSACVGT